MDRRIRAAVVGATGYTGAEVCRLLLGHPHADLAVATSGRSAGRTLRSQCPWLDCDLELVAFEPEKLDVDVAFLCQETGFAMEHAARLPDGVVAIDLSADFRLKDPAVYAEWYKRPHSAPERLPTAVYGLAEFADFSGAPTVIANPGCYPTATLLALKPLAGMIAGVPVVDAKSGVSGAGRSRAETDYLFSELSGGFKAYGVTGHRHTPEIEQELGGQKIRFTPHLIPAARGMEATIHVPLRVGRAEILDAWKSAYDGRPCVTVMEEGQPSTKMAHGTNRCFLAAEFDARTGYAVLTSVIDNLGKGAAGQAVQNMNLRFGLPEAAGLPLHGVWP